MFALNHIHTITINDVPLEWMTRIELFSSDLEQFPLMYVHILANSAQNHVVGDYNIEEKQRIFGFALSVKWSELKENKLCNVEIEFACNIPQNHAENYDDLILEELSHRIGLADKVEFSDLAEICQNNTKALPLLEKIWKDKIEVVYGKFIPHGRIFDEMYGIVRFSASGNAPRLGKTSEYRMLYWYMKDLGERITFGGEAGKYNFLECYLLPTYDELIIEEFNNFTKFHSFYLSTKFFWENEYRLDFDVDIHAFKYADKGTLPVGASAFETRYPALLGEHYDNISKLRQIFNRMPGRLYGYIWNLMTPVSTDYKTAFSERDTFKEFYRDHSRKKGSSSKVIACFLQQAFGVEAFPIDTWVKTFIYYPLGMHPKGEGGGEPSSEIQNVLYSKFKRLDKLEKIIWASSMGNKTNKTEFLDILWCQRYGTDKGAGGACRGANPLSCLNCSLKEVCLGYKAISNEKIAISDNKDQMKAVMLQKNVFFGVLTSNRTPRKVFTVHRNELSERDSHSGLDLPTRLQIDNNIMTVDEFMDSAQ